MRNTTHVNITILVWLALDVVEAVVIIIIMVAVVVLVAESCLAECQTKFA